MNQNSQAPKENQIFKLRAKDDCLVSSESKTNFEGFLNDFNQIFYLNVPYIIKIIN